MQQVSRKCCQFLVLLGIVFVNILLTFCTLLYSSWRNVDRVLYVVFDFTVKSVR